MTPADTAFKSPLIKHPITDPAFALEVAGAIIPNPLAEKAIGLVKHEALARDISPAEAKELAAELIDWAKGQSPAVTAVTPSQERAQRVAQEAAERISLPPAYTPSPTPQQNAALVAVTAALRSAMERLIDVVPEGPRKWTALAALEVAHSLSCRAICLDGTGNEWNEVDEP